LVRKIMKLGRETAQRSPRLRVSVSTLVPKAHTPFQWIGQNTGEQLEPKHNALRQGLKKTGAEFSWSDTETSFIEAILARGDRRLGKVIHRTWQAGSRLDTWREYFSFKNWMKAFKECGIDPSYYANRERDIAEPMPWDHIRTGVSSEFLKQEYTRMLKGEMTEDCRYDRCNACGLQSEPACRDKYFNT